jgi:hypothetical protein
VGAEDAVFLRHCLEEEAELAAELRGKEAVFGEGEVAEGVLGKKADGVGEEAEDDAHEEVRDLFAGERRGALLDLEALGEAEEIGGGGAGDADGGAVGAEIVVVGEEARRTSTGGRAQVGVSRLRRRSSRVKA